MPTRDLSSSGIVRGPDQKVDLAASAWVLLPTQLFAINGTWLYPPDGYQEMNVPVVGYTLNGKPVRQGYPSIVFTWSILKQEHLTALMQSYNPANPAVQVSYIDKTSGGIVTKYGWMEEPVIGARYIIYYQNVAVKITRLRDSL